MRIAVERESLDFWSKYYDFWDGFVGNWLNSWIDNNCAPNDGLTQMFVNNVGGKNGATELNMKELPEPYYGRGEDCCGVVVNLNPGASDRAEHAKIFGREGAWMISTLRTDCKGSYSLFAKQWASLRNNFEDVGEKNPSKIPGYKWWHSGNRMQFYKRFFESNPSELFVMEICPYHSAAWKGHMRMMDDYIVERIITPAIVAAKNVKKRCAVFMGSEINDVVSLVDGVTKVLDKKGTTRYRLYRCDPKDIAILEGKPVFLLVLDGMMGMKYPNGDDLRNKMIETEIDAIIMGKDIENIVVQDCVQCKKIKRQRIEKLI